MAAADADTELMAPPAATDPVPASAEPRPPAPPDAPAKPAAKGKGKAKDKSKAKGKGKAAPEPGSGPSVAAHPRAARAVARAKGWGALAGFLLGGYLSLPTHTLAEAMLRALLAGAICYVAIWAGALFVWRRLVVLELKAREQALLAPKTPRPPGSPPPPGGGQR